MWLVAVFDLKNLSADLMKGCSRLLMNPNWAWAGAGPRQRATRTQDSDQLIRIFFMILFDNGVDLNVFACYGQCVYKRYSLIHFSIWIEELLRSPLSLYLNVEYEMFAKLQQID